MRIAVASHPGRTITQHFGGATQFLVYAYRDGSVHLLDTRTNVPACQADPDEHDDALSRSIAAIQDCPFVVVARIGPGAHEAVIAAGLHVVVIHDEIDLALQRVVQSIPFQRACQKEGNS